MNSTPWDEYSSLVPKYFQFKAMPQVSRVIRSSQAANESDFELFWNDSVVIKRDFQSYPKYFNFYPKWFWIDSKRLRGDFMLFHVDPK